MSPKPVYGQLRDLPTTWKLTRISDPPLTDGNHLVTLMVTEWFPCILDRAMLCFGP
jgi:hypothetical protein